MTKEELAALLNGREYREEMTREEAADAKASGLVVVFGASDDLMEFRGAIYDETGAPGDARFGRSRKGNVELLTSDCEDDDCPYFAKLKEAAPTVTAKWDQDGFSWIYETSIPHAAFSIVESDGDVSEQYCRGIVFALADVPA